MPLDPRATESNEPGVRAAARSGDLERRVASLERALLVLGPAIGNGAPTTDPTTLRETTPYIDRTNRRLYYVVAGAWRWVALT